MFFNKVKIKTIQISYSDKEEKLILNTYLQNNPPMSPYHVIHCNKSNLGINFCTLSFVVQGNKEWFKLLKVVM